MSLALSPGPTVAPALRVNKRELARVLKVSLPTISAYLDRFEQFPVLQQGTNGREWLFDPNAVRVFLADREADEKQREAERNAEIGQIGLLLKEQDTARIDGALTPRERLDYTRALAAEDRLRQERGFLVSVPAERQMLTAAIARWNRSLHASIRQAGRDFNLPDAVTRGLVDRVAETQRQFVRELRIDAGLDDAAVA